MARTRRPHSAQRFPRGRNPIATSTTSVAWKSAPILRRVPVRLRGRDGLAVDHGRTIAGGH
jgi:hypothetical protein